MVWQNNMNDSNHLPVELPGDHSEQPFSAAAGALQQFCEQLSALLPAYSVGATSPEENRFIEATLPFCPQAQAALADYRALTDSLLYLIPLKEAPPPVSALLQRIAADEQQQLAALPPQPLPAISPRPAAVPPPTPPAAAHPARRTTALTALAAVLLLTLLGMNLFWMAQALRLQGEQQQLLQSLATDSAAPLVINNDNHHRELVAVADTASSAQATFVWNAADQVGALVVTGLAPLPGDQTYQLWLVREGHVLSLGTFRVDASGAGVLVFQAAEPISSFQHIGISIEPLPGSPEPTTPHLVIGSL